ncbi:MAG: Cof-type HAD-IIB family hydrolase [Aerococcus sp.]|nr:Cof-type HAD-IIB family hydrolase [Aerococcus sp.]
MIQLVAFDIDGTLLNDNHELVPSTKAALDQLHEKGIEIVINSGRPYSGVEPIVEKIGARRVRYASCFNGGLVLDLTTNDVLYQAALDAKDLADVANFALDQAVDVHTYAEKNIVLLDTPRYRYAEMEAEIVHMGVSVRDFINDPKDLSPTKMMITADPDRIVEVMEVLPKDFYTRFEIMRSAPYFLEFTPKNVNKGNGLMQLSEKTGIPQNCIMAFGDNENDIAMLKWAGVGIAMGNAIDSVKAMADSVTLDNNHDGIAESLMTYVFND